MINYFSRTDTFTIRADIYQSAIDYIQNSGFSLVTGIGYKEMGKLVVLFLSLQNYNAVLNSFENGFLDVIFLFGLLGFILLLYLLKIFLSKQPHVQKNIFPKLLVMNVIILGLTISHIFQLHVYPYVILSFFLFRYIPLDIKHAK